MALLHYTRLYTTLPLLFLTLPDSALLYHASTSFYLTVHNSTMTLLHSPCLHITLWFYFTPLYSTLLYIGSILHSTSLHIILPWLYFILLDSTLLYHGSTSLYFTLHYSTMALLHSTWLYITLQWLCLTLLDSTLLYYGSTSLHFTLHYSTMALLPSIWLYINLL